MDLGVDRPDVLAEDADEEQLHGTEEIDADQERRDTHLELVPPDEFGDQVGECDEEAQR